MDGENDMATCNEVVEALIEATRNGKLKWAACPYQTGWLFRHDETLCFSVTRTGEIFVSAPTSVTLLVKSSELLGLLERSLPLWHLIPRDDVLQRALDTLRVYNSAEGC